MISPDSNTDILADYDDQAPVKTTLFYLMLSLNALFIGGLNFILYFRTRAWSEDWLELLLVLIIPALGWVLLALRWRTGWFISTIYMNLFSYMIIFSCIKIWMSAGMTPADITAYIGPLIVLVITAGLSVLHWLNGVRRLLKIQPGLSITTLILLIILAIVASVASV